MKKIAVYTAIFGDKSFDSLKDFDKKYLDEADFYCFTNLPVKSDKWKMLVHPMGKEEDPRLLARQYKILPHLSMEDYDYHLWLDGSIQLLESPQKIVDQYMGKHDVTALLHPDRTCIYEEGKKCIEWGLDDPNKIDMQMQYIESQEYPHNNGLCETGMILRKNTKEVQIFSELWWAMVSTYSKRDQLSFNFCLWKSRLDYNTFDGLTNVQPNSPPGSKQIKIIKLHSHG